MVTGFVQQEGAVTYMQSVLPPMREYVQASQPWSRILLHETACLPTNARTAPHDVHTHTLGPVMDPRLLPTV